MRFRPLFFDERLPRSVASSPVLRGWKIACVFSFAVCWYLRIASCVRVDCFRLGKLDKLCAWTCTNSTIFVRVLNFHFGTKNTSILRICEVFAFRMAHSSNLSTRHSESKVEHGIRDTGSPGMGSISRGHALRPRSTRKHPYKVFGLHGTRVHAKWTGTAHNLRQNTFSILIFQVRVAKMLSALPWRRDTLIGERLSEPFWLTAENEARCRFN